MGRRGRRPGPLPVPGPYLILFGLFILAPSIYVIWISLHDWDFLLPGKPFVGLQNYVDLFTPGTITSGPFWSSMLATGKFVLYSVPLLVAIPLAVAVLLNQSSPAATSSGRLLRPLRARGGGDRDPVAVPARPQHRPGQPLPRQDRHPQHPLDHRDPMGVAALVGPTVWWTLGFNCVIYLAGLQDIPRELYEAAKVDGANAWRSSATSPCPACVRCWC